MFEVREVIIFCFALRLRLDIHKEGMKFSNVVLLLYRGLNPVSVEIGRCSEYPMTRPADSSTKQKHGCVLVYLTWSRRWSWPSPFPWNGRCWADSSFLLSLKKRLKHTTNPDTSLPFLMDQLRPSLM